MRTVLALVGLLIIVSVYLLVRMLLLSEMTFTASSNMTLTSSAFMNNGSIPSRYTCDGDSLVSPPLSISGVPKLAKSLVLIVDDPDVPKAIKANGAFNHWTLFNIPPGTINIPEGGSVGIAGSNEAGRNAYTGPCPPPQYEPSEHRYFFRIYGLDAELSLQAGASKTEVLEAMNGHVIATAELMGRYKRQSL